MRPRVQFGMLLICAMSTGLIGRSSALQVSTGSAPATTQSASANGDAIRGAFPALLDKTIDSKKLKEGDTVVAKTGVTLHPHNGAEIPRGTKVIGHVTQAKARSKGDSSSSLAIVFDKIEMGGGKDMPLHGVLQAVAPGVDNSPQTGAAGAGTLPGQGGVGTTPPPADGAVAGPNSGIHSIGVAGGNPILRPDAKGVSGIRNLQMDNDSVLTSSGKEVKLENGTQLLIRAEPQTAKQP